MKRVSVLSALCLAAAVSAVLVSATGEAQAPGGRTITLFQNGNQAKFKFFDSAPKSPAGISSPRFRVSVGDRFVIRAPLLDGSGKRIGTEYQDSTTVRGGSLDHALMLGHAVFKLADGEIIVEAAASGPQDVFAVTGGTGAYEGASGSVRLTRDSGPVVRLTVHLEG